MCGSEGGRGRSERGRRRAKDWCHSPNHLTKSPTSYGYSRVGRRIEKEQREGKKGGER